jgi:ATP-binding cassette subfamily F protein 1
LISRVCEDEEKSEIWVVEDGTVTSYPGTFEEYKEELQREIKAEVDDD